MQLGSMFEPATEAAARMNEAAERQRHNARELVVAQNRVAAAQMYEAQLQQGVQNTVQAMCNRMNPLVLHLARQQPEPTIVMLQGSQPPQPPGGGGAMLAGSASHKIA